MRLTFTAAQSGATFMRTGLGLFVFGIVLTFGIIGHYCIGANHPTGAVFLQNVTLWYACPWTLSVAVDPGGWTRHGGAGRRSAPRGTLRAR